MWPDFLHGPNCPRLAGGADRIGDSSRQFHDALHANSLGLSEKAFFIAPALANAAFRGKERSERFQPRDELGIVKPLRGVRVPFDLRFSFCYSLAFGLQIKGEVLVRGVHAGVSKPLSDGAEVDP